MSITSDAIANATYRLGQMAREIDADPDIAVIRIALVVNPKSRKIQRCIVHVEREFDVAPPGVAIRQQLDSGIAP